MKAPQLAVIRKPDWLRERDYRIAHRRTPDERWWTVVDGLARPGPKHYEILNFVPCEPFRFAGFDIDPASPFVVEDFIVDGQSVPMPYPFMAAQMLPRVDHKRRPMLLPADTTVTLKLRNTLAQAVPFTVRLLAPEDLR